MTSIPESQRLVESPLLLWSARAGEVAVVAGAGELADVVDDLCRAVLLSLAEGPRALVCNLTAVTDGSDSDARLLLATMGEQARDWPAVPLAVACPDPSLRHRLRQAPLSEHVLLRAALGPATSAVARIAPPLIARLQLAPHVTASRVARDFVSRTCLDWGLPQGIASACLVVSELVTNGQRHAVTDMDLTLALHGGILRLTVRDGSSEPLMVEQAWDLESIHGRGLALVAACSRAWGTLPTIEGGKVVWSVLDV